MTSEVTRSFRSAQANASWARVGFPVRLALKDLELVREVEQSSKAVMPLLDAVYEVGRSG